MENRKIIKGRVIKKNVKENEDVYDIKVLNNHNFFANGVLVHNCGEIILRDRETCNLTEVIIRGTDTEKTLMRKVKIATILGTWQSTLTNYRYVSKKWKENAEEERLLGVSLTGIQDCAYTNGKEPGLENRLANLRAHAIKINAEMSSEIGISPSVAITTGKPSGTVSQLVDSSSGIHARHSPYYIRTVRADKKDPLAKLMIDAGFPHEDDVMKPDSTYVFSFPIKSPEKAVYRSEQNALDQLELWLTYKTHWAEHNMSVTVSVREHEWMEVGAWVYKNFDVATAISFLPYSEHIYKQAPYQECTKEEYEEFAKKMPKTIDWSKLSEYEKTDLTEGAQTLACTSAGGCEI